jgi:phage gpG-like protein
MAAVVVTGGNELRAHLGVLARRAKDRRPLMEEAGRYMVNTAIPRIFRAGGPGWPAVARGGRPLRDTGRLQSSITYRAGNDLVVGTNLIYSRIHQEGGTIRAKSGKYLAIPLPTLSVSERRTKGPRDFPNTFIARSRAGNLIVFQRNGSAVRPLFVLKTSVTIKRRKFLRFDPSALQAISRRWTTMIRDGR